MRIISGSLDAIIRIARQASSGARYLFYRALGVQMKGFVRLGSIEIPSNFSDISLAAGVSLDDGVVLLAVGAGTGKKKIRIGENTHVNRNSFIDAADDIRIGRNVTIGPNCYITDHDHGTQAGRLILEQPLISTATMICDGVRLGAGVTVVKGVTIGANSVVAPGSIVTRDLPPDVMAGGRPASAMKKR